jgi:hypothetical protein
MLLIDHHPESDKHVQFHTDHGHIDDVPVVHKPNCDRRGRPGVGALKGITIDRPSGSADIRLRPLPSPMLTAVPSEAVRLALPEASCAPKSNRR